MVRWSRKYPYKWSWKYWRGQRNHKIELLRKDGGFIYKFPPWWNMDIFWSYTTWNIETYFYRLQLDCSTHKKPKSNSAKNDLD